MPPADKYNEILIVSVAGMIILFVISATVVFILLSYQKKKFRHRQQIDDMQKRFSEEMLRSQLEIQEETFNRISQEIHDNVGQIMSLAKVQINIITESKDMKREMLDDVKENIGMAMRDLRDIARSLSSERIKMQSIHAATISEAERINKTGIIRVEVEVEGEEMKIKEEKKLILFRIIQESLQNIIKHAGASETRILFRYAAGELHTLIQDNGKGFNIGEALLRSTGLGLSNIKTRATLAGGSTQYESVPGKGTTVIINMPYE